MRSRALSWVGGSSRTAWLKIHSASWPIAWLAWESIRSKEVAIAYGKALRHGEEGRHKTALLPPFHSALSLTSQSANPAQDPHVRRSTPTRHPARYRPVSAHPM